MEWVVLLGGAHSIMVYRIASPVQSSLLKATDFSLALHSSSISTHQISPP